MRPILLCGLFLGTAVPVGALSPMSSYHDLVAGEGSPGLQDGAFYEALFREPQGLALDPEGGKLYVGDRGNHAIRVVDLARGNLVSTLAGNGTEGAKDGSFSEAAFKHPEKLVYLPGNRLAVHDYGNARIRLLDLRKRTVTTLLEAPGIWDLVHLPGQEALYFSRPAAGLVGKVDLRNGEVVSVMEKHEMIPSPGALAVMGGNLIVADRGHEYVHELRPKEGAAPGEFPFNLEPAGRGKGILALAVSGGSLYAFRNDKKEPLVRLLPDHRPVSLYSPWADKMAGRAQTAFLDVAGRGSPPALVPDPASAGRFFLAHPSRNSITALRDLELGPLFWADLRNSGGLTDLEYPQAKPPGTFRILLMGDSRTFHVAADYSRERGSAGIPRVQTQAKRMELVLNALASLRDLPNRYEVLHQGKVSWEPLFLWPYYTAPEAVKAYDIDLVVLLMSPQAVHLQAYYERPLTKEGVPAEAVDPEHLLRPLSERTPPGLPGDFLRQCRDLGVATVEGDKEVWFKDLPEMMGHPEVLEPAAELLSRPFRLLAEKLRSTRTLQGKPVRLLFGVLPNGEFQAFQQQKPFWDLVTKRIGASSLNLMDPMTALRPSFYPFAEAADNSHLTPDGHLLMGLLLAHELIRAGEIPFK